MHAFYSTCISLLLLDLSIYITRHRRSRIMNCSLTGKREVKLESVFRPCCPPHRCFTWGVTWTRMRRLSCRCSRRSSECGSERWRSCGRTTPGGCSRWPDEPSAHSRPCRRRSPVCSRTNGGCRTRWRCCSLRERSWRRSAWTSGRSRPKSCPGWRRPSGRWERLSSSLTSGA